MDTWKFYDITHREHVVCNPTSEEKLARLVELLRLPSEAQVVDIACGKGEFLIRLADAYGVRGLGIDISPFFVAEAKRRLDARAPRAGITFTEMNGSDFRPEKPHSLDLASCVGASWVFGGHAATLDALVSMVKPGGWVVVGEPYWLQEPSEYYLEASGLARDDVGSHASNAESGEQRGLDLVHTIVSSHDDWDRYEGLQWYATDEYARSHPDDSDLAEVVARVGEARAAYLRWGRDTLGWAIYVFRLRPVPFLVSAPCAACKGEGRTNEQVCPACHGTGVERFYHGTKAQLKPGDLIEPGRRANIGEPGRVANYVYMSGTLDAATWGAELAQGEGRGRIYVVEPTSPIEDDPNLTDKRYPGNPTKSYRSREPLRVTGEVADWRGHSPQELKAMKDGLERLEREGAMVIDD